MAIDPCASAGRKEDGGACNVLWLASPFARDLRDRRIIDGVILRRHFRHIAWEESGRDGIHIDMVRRQIGRQMFGQMNDTRLTG